MRWLLRAFANAFVRRVAYIVVAVLAALVAQAVTSVAHAAIDQGEAYANCQHQIRKTSSDYPGSSGRCTEDGGAFRCTFSHPNATGGAWVDCVPERYFPFQGSCASRNTRNPPGDSGLSFSAPPTCIGGCRLLGTPFSSQTGGVKIYGLKDRYYSGDVCEAPGGTPGISPEPPSKEDQAKPKPPECVALGSGQTGCLKPDGQYCATASTGKTFCWSPNETGEKKDGTDAQTKEQQGKPVTAPPSPDPEKEYQRKEGHQQTACINNTCTTYNVTNFNETGKGTSKNSTGDNNADGSGNTSGNGTPGKGSGSGDKEGEGDSASDSGNCETPPLCTGDTLKCLHLRYTWKSQCNTMKDTVTGGDDCGAGNVPVCAGKGCKAQEYASLLQQWRGRCAAEGDRAKLAGDAAAGAADAAGDNEGDAVADLWKKGPGQDGQGLDRDKLTLGGGELFPSIDIMGTAWAPPAQLYSVLNMIRQLVIAAGALAAMYILFRK